MNNAHESYLRSFFVGMNERFSNEWCVLHSYETLPFFSESDVDMAFSNPNIKDLESLIVEVAKQNQWSLYQKLWYDIEYCLYYVLKKDDKEVFLALDFLLDNQAIGKYGFKTSLLTNNCNTFEKNIRIPNHEVAFCYKLVKRLVKNLDLAKDEDYLFEQFDQSKTNVIYQILEDQFGKRGMCLLREKLQERNLSLSASELDFLDKSKKHKAILKLTIFPKTYWHLYRFLTRVIYPCGMIIQVPLVSNEELMEFSNLLRKKVDILFRFVRINHSNSLADNIKGVVGSTLIICPMASYDINNAVKDHWFLPSKSGVRERASNNLETMVEDYYHAILIMLRNRISPKIPDNE